MGNAIYESKSSLVLFILSYDQRADMLKYEDNPCRYKNIIMVNFKVFKFEK